MIISASRRTDIPRFYYDWLLARLRAGFALVRNPMNAGQISRVALAREVVDGIVFWTKDPAPMLGRLGELGDLPWYMQFTLNAYGRELESALPPAEQRVKTFLALAEQAGPNKLIWRYSPVALSADYTAQFHLAQFERLARSLRGATGRCNLSFLDFYEKIRPAMRALGIERPAPQQLAELARGFRAIAAANGIELAMCGGDAMGIKPARCVDYALLGEVTGRRYSAKKDPGQRGECGCAISVDIGSYNCCENGCAYCYANRAAGAAGCRSRYYDESAPMLCDAPRPGDTITERAMRSLECPQISLF